MELVHRLLWQTDNRELLHDAKEIIQSRYQLQNIAERSLVSNDLTVHEFKLTTDFKTEVSLRIIEEDEAKYLWIDAEAESHSSEPLFLQEVGTLSQLLIKKSFSSGDRPYLNDIFVDADLPNPKKDGVVEYFVKSLFARNRSISMIVIAYDPLASDETPGILTAKSLLKDFSGVAMVLYLQQGLSLIHI